MRFISKSDVLFILLLIMIFLSQMRVVEAEPKTIIVPDDYFTIQEAIDNIADGDTVFVKSGIYNEVLLINKSLSLIGENKESTIINGHNNGTVILIRQDSVNIKGFTLLNGDSQFSFSGFFPQLTRLAGIHLLHVSNCSIVDNKVENSGCGIWLYGADNNTIVGNEVRHNSFGVRFHSSTNNMLRNNHFSDSLYNFYINEPNSLLPVEDFINDVDASNTVDSKPIYYWVNKSSSVIPPEAGQVILVNCTGVTVQNSFIINNNRIFLFHTQNSTIIHNEISNSSFGIYLFESSDNNIGENKITNNLYGGILLNSGSSKNYVYGNNIKNNGCGIQIVVSSSTNRVFGNYIVNNDIGLQVTSNSEKNSVIGNNITSNDYGFVTWDSSSVLYNNNFIENSIAINARGTKNVWDNGTSGNYWNAYNGTDPDEDGIGDAPYIIDDYNQDNYPLVNPVDISEIPEFPSWTILFVGLSVVLVLSIIFRQRIKKGMKT